MTQKLMKKKPKKKLMIFFPLFFTGLLILLRSETRCSMQAPRTGLGESLMESSVNFKQQIPLRYALITSETKHTRLHSFDLCIIGCVDLNYDFLVGCLINS